MTITAKPPRFARADRAALWFLTACAAFVGLSIAVVTTVGLVQILVTGETTLTVGTDSPMPAGLYPAGLELESARFTEGTITTDDLSGGAAIPLALAHLLTGLSQVIVALAVVHLGRSILRGDPFRRSVVRSTVTASLALVVGSAVAIALVAIGTTVAMGELIGEEFMTEKYPLLLSFDLTPFLVGVGIGIVAGAFEIGGRLRADTEGLV